MTEAQRRNQEIIARYLAGETRPQLAGAYGLSVKTVGNIIYRAGVRLSDAERERRFRIPCKAYRGGRHPVWPGCPDHLRRQYRKLRNYMPAREARAALEHLA